MTVLIAFASKHGSTADIARVIGHVLKDRRLKVDIKYAEDVTNLKNYDAIVLGSAVYAGRWLKPARQFVKQFNAQLVVKPVWLFSSGPIGNVAPNDHSVNIGPIVKSVAPIEHRVFAGKLDKSQLSFAERAVVMAVGAKDGDYRNWDEVKAWAQAIARSVKI